MLHRFAMMGEQLHTLTKGWGVQRVKGYSLTHTSDYDYEVLTLSRRVQLTVTSTARDP